MGIDRIIDWLGANWLALLPVLVPSGIFAFAFSFRTFLRTKFEEMSPVVQIKRGSDPHIKVIEKIQQTFPEDERDPAGILAERISETRFDFFGVPRGDTWMMCFYYRRRGVIVGYLSAQYFTETQTIFFWYLVHSRDRGDAAALTDEKETEATRDVAVALIHALLRACDRDSHWQHLVAEVDAAGTDLRSARARVRRFQQYAAALVAISKKKGLDRSSPRVFKVDMSYVMPLHDNDELHNAKVHETPGWLIYAPRVPEALKARPGYVASNETVRTLLYSTLVLGYYDVEDEDYNAYIKSFFVEMADRLPAQLRLIHERKYM